MSYIKGKIKKIIFNNNESGFSVALFRVLKTDDNELKDSINKTITITGVFTDLNLDILMTLYGNYIENERFGMQYKVDKYEIDIPTTKESIIEFLSSKFIDGCGERTAKKIVDLYGEEALNIIKNDKEKLLNVDGITLAKAEKIYNSLIEFNKSSDYIIKFQNMGFSIEECSKIVNHFKNRLESILNDDFYDLKEIIDFNKIDNIFINNHDKNSLIRINACILESMQIISFSEGSTYYSKETILYVLKNNFNIELNYELFDELIDELIKKELIIIDGERYYLKKYYDMEYNVANTLKHIDSFEPIKFKNIDKKLIDLEHSMNIDYNTDQEKAITTALNNNITIISGGPGTGKTTIIKAIVQLYINEYKLGPQDIMENIALLAPTGRASKKLSSSTHLPAYTIHRYLKWYKDSNDFFYNKLNKTHHKLIIVDEVSMIDIDLFNALLNGISPNIKLILVGDIFQLPSVGPGLVLKDLIDSEFFNFVPLNIIYRQSDNSYIPYLAKDIKNVELTEEFLSKKDDYNFIQTDSTNIKEALEEIIKVSIQKGITEKDLQVLVPMYKGENGIDNLNIVLQNIYNPSSNKKEEIVYYDTIYREGDKVIQLVNDIECNVFNGDIGYIKEINNKTITIDYDGNLVEYEKKDLKEIKHAYAITIHKSQGSEFDHVIMPIAKNYFKMLYNKLIYTGVSRAKKTLTIIGDPMYFARGIQNNYSSERKTTLKEKIISVYNN